MRLNKILLLSIAIASGLAMAAEPAKKKKKKKKAPAPAAAAPATTEEAAPAATEEAAPAAPAETYRPAYGMAGCGLGTFVFKDDNMMQIFAATTNGTSGNQTFGITSGTSNCANKKAMAMEQKVFVEANFASLNREAASGEGETLTAFASLLGCDAQLFSKVSKENHDQLYQTQESVLTGYKTLLADQCSRVI